MKESKELYALIQVLSPAEKRHFKMQSGLQKGEKKYLILFDLLGKQKEYDEKSIRKRLGNVSKNQYNFIRNYLYNSLLSSLVQFHNKPVDTQIHDGLRKAILLHQKGLPRHSKKELSKAKKVASAEEKHIDKANILLWEKRILFEGLEKKNYYEYIGKSKAIIGELENISKEIRSEDIRSTLAFWHNNFGSPRTKEQIDKQLSLLSDPLFEELESNPDLPFRIKINLLKSRMIYYLNIKDASNTLDYALRILTLREKNPQRISRNILEYINDLNAVLNAYSELNDPSNYYAFLNKLKALPDQFRVLKTSMEFKAYHFFMCFNSEMAFLLKAFRIKDALKPCLTVEKEFGEFQTYFSSEQATFLLYHSGLIFLGNCEYGKALVNFNSVLTDYGVSAPSWIQHRIQLLSLIIHFQLGNDKLLEHLIISVYRNLLRKQNLYNYEKAIIRFIRKLGDIADSSKLSLHFRNMKTELIKASSDPLEKGFCIWIIYWLEGIESDKTLKEVFLEKSGNEDNFQVA